MKRSAMAVMAMIAAGIGAPSTGSSGTWGLPATPEMKDAKRKAREARAPRLLAKAEAKRQRKAAARIAARDGIASDDTTPGRAA